MSRAYDAKQQVLKAYPDDKDAGISLFLDFLDMDEEDFEYEWNQTPEEYVYGK